MDEVSTGESDAIGVIISHDVGGKAGWDVGGARAGLFDNLDSFRLELISHTTRSLSLTCGS